MALRDLDSTYLGVSVDDRDPQAIFDSMLALAESRLPQWEPKNGALETVLMEATATGMADLVYAANRVLGALVEGVINLYGVTRDEGTPATGTVRLTLTGSPTTVIDEGTLFRIEDADSMLVATETVTVTGGTLDVAVATTDTGGYLNAIVAGTACDPVVAVPHLANCVLLTDLNGGSDAMDDLAFLTKASTTFSRVTSALVTAPSFAAYALEQSYVKRAVAVDQYDHDGGNAPGDDDGFLTVYVYGNGAAISADEKSELAGGDAGAVRIHPDDDRGARHPRECERHRGGDEGHRLRRHRTRGRHRGCAGVGVVVADFRLRRRRRTPRRAGRHRIGARCRLGHVADAAIDHRVGRLRRVRGHRHRQPDHHLRGGAMPYVYDFDALYDFDLSYDGWPLYDTGTPTGITRTGQRLFDLLPEYVRDADTRDELLRFMASIGDAAHPVAKFIDDADPDTSASGTSEPVNPATTPAGWLPWLGWLIGVPVVGMDTSERPLVSVPGRRPGPRVGGGDPGGRAGHTDRQPLLPGHHGRRR
jgi:hypothetical protein